MTTLETTDLTHANDPEKVYPDENWLKESIGWPATSCDSLPFFYGVRSQLLIFFSYYEIIFY